MAILINANGYSPVTAQEDADLYAGLVGDGRFVLSSVGNKMTAEPVSSNLIRVMDGVMVTHGRMLYIGAGSYDEFTIPNGAQGSTNYYIIGYHIYTDSSSDEHCETFVRQMSTATATIEEASLRDGASESYVSLYRVTQSGINISTIEPLFTETEGVGGKLDGAGLNADYEGIIASHGTDTDAPSTSVIYKLYQSFQDGVTRIYDAVVSNGVTPASRALSAIVAAIDLIRSGGNATAGQILDGRQAYVGKTLVTGTMPNSGSVSRTIAPGGSYTIPKGYHDGTGKVTASNKTLHVVKVGTYNSGSGNSAKTYNVATYVSKGCNINNFALRNVVQTNDYSGATSNFYGSGSITMTLSGNTLSIAQWLGADRDLDGDLRNHRITADVYVYYVE